MQNPMKMAYIWEGGMSFHGGLLGVVVVSITYALKNKFHPLALGDILGTVAPIGLFFGRLANFINGELYGRITTVHWAMVFPSDSGGLPRHPSQLYEAFLEGLCLFLIMFFAARNPNVRRRTGMLFGIFVTGYGLSRFIVEFYREPDQQVGFILQYFTMGQLLSLPMILAGIVLIVYAKKHKNQLHNEIAARIREQGPIPVAEYMGLAADVYYKTQEAFGVRGDFTTAPEISQMFGEMIAIWLVDMWVKMGQPAEVKLVELGPGRGTLAADILRTVAAWPDFKAAITLHLVETSPRLREIQAGALKGYGPAWHDSFSEVPEGFCFVIANEFFDALPVQQFVKTEEGWRERCVDYDVSTDAFSFTLAKDPHPNLLPEGEGTCAHLPPLPPGEGGAHRRWEGEGLYEISSVSQAIIKQISDAHRPPRRRGVDCGLRSF